MNMVRVRLHVVIGNYEPHASSVTAKRGEPHTDQENIDVVTLGADFQTPFLAIP